MGGGGLGLKVLFRANWNLICCVPGQIQGWETQVELLVLPRLNPGVQGEHLLRQLSWNATSVLVTCVCPVYLVDELILISVPFSPIAGLVVAPLMFFNTWWVWFKSYGKSVLFWGMDMELKDKIMWIAPRKWNVSRVWYSRRRYRVRYRQFTSMRLVNIYIYKYIYVYIHISLSDLILIMKMLSLISRIINHSMKT